MENKMVDFTYPQGITEACNECLDFLPAEEREATMMAFIDIVIAL